MDDQQLLRYSRQIMLKDFDIKGQQALLDASVLIVGLGGLGCPVAMYLAAAGVGQLTLADFDQVDLSNLQRQIAHTTKSIGLDKVDSAKSSLLALNDQVKIDLIKHQLTGEALLAAVSAVDLVVDASDNFATRFEINRACHALQKPLVSGAAIRTEGQVVIFDHRQTDSPCYRCLYDDGAEDTQLSCSESGVLSPVVGVIGSIQAVEAIKILADFGRPLQSKLLLFDALDMQWRTLSLTKDPACPVCS